MSSVPQKTKPNFLPSIDTPSSNSPGDVTTTIFSKRKMQLRIPPTYGNCNFMHLTCSKNWLVCILTGPAPQTQTTLLRFFLPRAIPPGEIVLDKYLAGYKIAKIFLDPTGHHLLISLVPLPESPGLSADFLYIHANGPKVRRIEKFKDHEITSVAFNNYAGTESSTGSILLGTRRGLIFETELVQEADKPSFRKQVYDLGVGRPMYPITGLELLRMPNNSNKYIVVATAPDFIYTFQETLKPEDKSMQSIFAAYVNGTRLHTAEEVKTDFNYSVLSFFSPPNAKYPKQWGWLCGAGVRMGEVSTDATSDAVLLGDDLISSDFKLRQHLSFDERRQSFPKSFVLTEFHALLLYTDHITAICLLNQQVIYEEYFGERMGKLLNIVRDAFTGIIYFYTDKAVYNFKIVDEQCYIWKIYLDKGLYEMAEIYAAEKPEQLDIVWVKKAEKAFEAKEYELAASLYADTNKTFEEICLKFMPLEDKLPIITYVKKCLQKIGESAEHITALVVWLIDLYLTQINFPGRSAEVRAQWQSDFDAFMLDTRVAKCTLENRSTIQQLIAQHADSHNLAQFAIANGDYEEVITQHLKAENYSEALDILRKQKNFDLYYKYCPILIEHLPQQTVDLLMSKGRKLRIDQLVPTLITTDSPKHVEEIMKYIEYAIYQLDESNQAIHNYILRLYAEHRPAKVIAYLRNQGNDVSLVQYDINYALSVCMDFEAKEPCVFLQCLLRMYVAAVDLALGFDMRLAKETAMKPSDEETRRKLWLRIAYHDIKGTNDVKKALDLLKECDLLRIEDLLPFFSDFEKIDDFKEPICAALKDYNKKILELQQDMAMCTINAERVRNDLQTVRERSIRIEAQEICAICESFLLIKAFFVFACGHKFHADCLEKQVVPLLSSEKSRKLTMLKQQLESVISQSTSNQSYKQREKLKLEIEEILASDCLCCGLMIETIDQPFVEDWDQVNVDWE